VSGISMAANGSDNRGSVPGLHRLERRDDHGISRSTVGAARARTTPVTVRLR
jgi:hypothetical protein